MAATAENAQGTRAAAPTLARYWHPIAASEDVTDQPKRFVLLDVKLVAFRDADGVAVFEDLCIHRGAALSLGWITDGRLTCPYHGWEYDRSGTCVRIPALPEGQAIPRKARAITHRVREAYGLVWVALEEPVAPIPASPDGVWEKPEWHRFLAYRCRWHTSAGRAVENFMDFSHFPFVHTGILGTLDKTVIGRDQVEPVAETDFGLRYSYEGEEPNELYASAGARSRYEYSVYLPFTVHFKRVQPDGKITLISLCTQPISATESELFVMITRDHSLDVDDATFAEVTITIMEQDRRVVESQRPERIPVDLKEELHLKLPDENAVIYRRALARIGESASFMP